DSVTVASGVSSAMDRKEEEKIVARLAEEFSGRLDVLPSGGAHETLQRMVSAGASRFGYRADRREDSGFDACSLAPPLAQMIDHTALKPETTEDQIRALCTEARKYCFASVCVNPCHVRLVATELSGSSVAVCTVIGFPFGANRTATKRTEARLAIEDGATELDMVLNVGYLKSGRYDDVEDDIRGVVEETRAHSRGRLVVKVILETALLTDEEKVVACVLAQNAKADFVKTSTGFSKGGATTPDVALMRRVVGRSMGVKASGGVRSKEDAESMIAHGASRIGASASVEIVKGLAGKTSY
ncbi:MAG: deoxyribose-phosphate aldolase, partial [Rhodothermales bacterium]|nr:deoxyribose-phosphate aldolase [Rhodothermales bacterium]